MSVPQIRILMTLDAVGGVWRFAMELARPLRRLGVATLFCGLGPAPSAAQRAEAEALGELVWLDLPLDWMARDEAALGDVPRRIAALGEESGCALLHLNLPSQAAGMATDLPVVAMSHSCLPTWWEAMRGEPLPGRLSWQAGLNRAGFAKAGAVVAPSASHADALERVYGRLPRLEVVHNAIAAFIGRAEREPFVLAAGRWWDEGKNAATIDAAAASSPWPVRMAGALEHPEGGGIAPLHAEAHGPLPHASVMDLVRRAGVVVSASRYEPFGLSALEGARAGAPLILSAIPVYRELWRGAALYFDPRDPQALARRIAEYAADPSLRMAMGELALARSRRFTPDRQARALMEIYRSLLPSLQPKEDAAA